MSFRFKLKIENMGILTTGAFYAVVGVVCFVLLPMANFPPHVGILGILSLITAYGLFKKRVWTIWFIIMLFFIATTFSAYTLYYYIGGNLLLSMSTVAYLVLTWIFTAYMTAKRNSLHS